MIFICSANRRFYQLMMVCIIFLSAADVAHCRETVRVVLFASKNIKPYVEAVDGFRAGLEAALEATPEASMDAGASIEADVEVIMLDRYTDASRTDLADRIANRKKTDLLAAIGPEAALFVWEAFAESDIAKMYALILNPEKLIPEASPASGISLNIPPSEQLRLISASLPAVSRVGVFYDPALNADFYEAAEGATLELDVDLVPLAVNTRKDIPFLLEECWDSIDCVWLIPDRTVISESISQYIIKQAVLMKVPVVGYNRFFYDSGAAMAFVFDYADLGRQAAGLAVDILFQQSASPVPPVFKVWLNASVLNKLAIPLPEPLHAPMMVGP
jgi:putative ABC transport system substrate-binding protein